MGRGISDNLLSLGGGLIGSFFGPAGAAIGSGLGSLAEGDDFGEAMMGGLMSFGVGSALQGLGSTGSAFAKGGAEEAAKLAAKEGITDGLFTKIGSDTFSNISAGAGTEAGLGGFLSSAIKNPKVYTGLGAAGVGLLGSGAIDETTPLPVDRAISSRQPNLTTGPLRAKFAPPADFAPGFDPEFNFGFAEGGIVSGNRNYADGSGIEGIDILANPNNRGEAFGNLGPLISGANTFGNLGIPGVGTVIGAIGSGMAANDYQDALTRQGITNQDRYNISGPEAILGSITQGVIGDTARTQYNNRLSEVQDRLDRAALEQAQRGPFAPSAITPYQMNINPSDVAVTSDNMNPVDDGGDDDDVNNPNGGLSLDLNAMANAPGLDDNPLGLEANEENLASLVAGQGPAFNIVAGSVDGYNDIGPAVDNAIQGMQRDVAYSDTVTQGSLDDGYAGVSNEAFSNPGFGEGVDDGGDGMGSSWAQGGLVPGSMNQPQKRYFGIYKQGGPVRSYALGENVDAIEAEQVQQNPIVVEAVAAITGNHPNPEAAIMQFVKIYGQEALVALRDEIVAEASSEERQASGLGALSGPGTGLSDDIPAEVQDRGMSEPAALSVGEQVVPADVVAMLGDGSTEAGSRKLDNMVDEVRMQKTGTRQQAGPLDMNRVEGMVA